MTDCVVAVREGQIRGKIATDHFGRDFYSFQGVPYAKPPLGELRFKAPEPPVPWVGVRDATVEGSECYSHHMLDNRLIGSEDCLVLNVYTPKQGDACKPVMVFIHGGGFTKGSSNFYGPDFLMHEDVVLVTINYRLGMLGFLCVEDASLGVPGNAGLKDMVMALKWVQNNISNFSGDPENVTIFGNSAGGSAVHYLMLSPMAVGLFQKGISQSGSALNNWAQGTRGVEKIAKAMGLDGAKEADVLKRLRLLKAEQILEIQDAVKDSFEYCYVRPIGPVVEKRSTEPAFLSEEIIDVMMNGNYTKVPYMIGYTSKEGFLYEVIQSNVVVADFEDCVPHSMKLPKGSDSSKQIADKIKHFYLGSSTDVDLDVHYDLRSDVFINRGVYSAARNHSVISDKPVYFYKFSMDTKLNIFKSFLKINRPGACHADELGYLFKTIVTPQIEPGSLEEACMRKVIRVWANFARSGDPNDSKGEDVVWKPMQKGEMHFLDIGDTLTVGTNPDSQRMAFWDEIYELNSATIHL